MLAQHVEKLAEVLEGHFFVSPTSDTPEPVSRAQRST
jgi:hypothetical protein